MTRMKLVIVVGARPNFIKVAPFMDRAKTYRSISVILVHTGQHYDEHMSKTFFGEFDIPRPHYNLGVGSGGHALQTARIMERLEPVMLKEKPDVVLVFGDINSTLAGALVASKLAIPITHVEAGMRCYDKTVPEEINRVLTDHLSSVLFCSTKHAVQNLKKEGLTKHVYNVGDIMYDAFLKHVAKAEQVSPILAKLKLQAKAYHVLTVHRPVNTDNPKRLRAILSALKKSGERIIFPVHPRTLQSLKTLSLNKKKYPSVSFIDPLSYSDILMLVSKATTLLTDSGGLQKEAYWLKTPCITLREETEWQETVRDGWNTVVGVDEKAIVDALKTFRPTSKQHDYFGDGATAKKILDTLLSIYGKKR